MKYKSLVALALATAFLPGLSNAQSNVQNEEALKKALSDEGEVLDQTAFTSLLNEYGFITQFTTGFVGGFGAEHNDEPDAFFKKPKPLFNYFSIATIGGHSYTKYTGSNLKLLYGATVMLYDETPLKDENGSFKTFFEKDPTNPQAQFVGKDIYVGLGSTYGNLKYGRLGINPGNSQIDFGFSPGTAAALSIYGRYDFRLSHAIRYESPQFFDGLSFSLITGEGAQLANWKSAVKQPAIAGNSEQTEIEVSKAEPVTRKSRLFGGSFNYKKDAFFVKVSGVINPTGIDKDATEPVKAGDGTDGKATAGAEAAQSLRLEGGYEKDNLFVGLGFQRSVSNTGWGLGQFNDTQKEASKDKIYGSKFTTNELAASGSYTIGKFVPKFSFGLGQEAKNEAKAGIETTSGYKQFIAGCDYQFSDALIFSTYAGRVDFDTDSWKDQQTAGVAVAYVF